MATVAKTVSIDMAPTNKQRYWKPAEWSSWWNESSTTESNSLVSLVPAQDAWLGVLGNHNSNSLTYTPEAHKDIRLC